jgi:N-acetyl-gamma-glutamyl-phosphate reductase
MLRIGIVGASGYSGAVATSLLAAHPEATIAFATSDKLVGQSVDDHVGIPVGGLSFTPNDSAAAAAAGCDAVMLCTSAEVSSKLAPQVLALGKRVIDFSGAFRLATADAYPRWYGFEHPAAELLARAHYGLPEVNGPPPSGTTLIANPGCYATAALLALAPLLAADLVEPTGLLVDGKSGISGAGRQAKEDYSFTELDEDVRAYKLLGHQHTPEITRFASRAGGVRLTFTPHLIPLRRGLIVTCYARPRPGASAARVAECMASAYEKTPFVKAVAPDRVRIAGVAGTNRALVGATANDDVVIAIAAIDNLGKGAAGQAVQNMNLLFDLPETLGLSHLAKVAP